MADIPDVFIRLEEILDERLDCMEMTLTQLIRLRILVEKSIIPPRLLEEYDEFVVDWKANISKFVDLSKEESELLLLVVDDTVNLIEKQIVKIEEN